MNKIKYLLNTAGHIINKNSPTILTGLAVGGVVGLGVITKLSVDKRNRKCCESDNLDVLSYADNDDNVNSVDELN